MVLVVLHKMKDGDVSNSHSTVGIRVTRTWTSWMPGTGKTTMVSIDGGNDSCLDTEDTILNWRDGFYVCTSGPCKNMTQYYMRNSARTQEDTRGTTQFLELAALVGWAQEDCGAIVWCSVGADPQDMDGHA